MTHTSLWPAAVILSATLAAALALGDEDTSGRKFKDVLEFDGPRPQGDEDYLTSVGGFDWNKQNKPVARRAAVRPLYLCRGRHLGRDFCVRYPDLAVGDAAPFFGAFYRVIRVSGDKTNPRMQVKRVPKEKLPPHAKLGIATFAAPLASYGRGSAHLHDADVRVEAIDAPAKKGEKPTAKISVSYLARGKGDVVDEVTVKPGDLVLLHKAGHKVLAVAPPDAKSKLIGWVEFDADPLLEADMISNKVDFIRPTPRKK